jgi:hypothetical protein
MVAAAGLVTRGQQLPDPCDAASFNPKICKTAVRRGGYCFEGKWVPATYQQPYPYYYDLYQEYALQGGMVDTPRWGNCGHGFFSAIGVTHGVAHGGFGSTGSGHSAHC